MIRISNIFGILLLSIAIFSSARIFKTTDENKIKFDVLLLFKRCDALNFEFFIKIRRIIWIF